MEKHKFDTVFDKGIKKLGLEGDTILKERLWLYMNYLLEENKKYNLTALNSEEDNNQTFSRFPVFFYKIPFEFWNENYRYRNWCWISWISIEDIPTGYKDGFTGFNKKKDQFPE